MFKRILLLVDSSEASLATTEHAIAMAKQYQIELLALSVVDVATLRELLTYKIMVPEEMEEYERELESSARHQLAIVEEMARVAGVQIQTFQAKGVIHAVTVTYQKTHGADLVVLGYYKASQVNRDLLAREKQQILDECSCPVMIVKKR